MKSRASYWGDARTQWSTAGALQSTHLPIPWTGRCSDHADTTKVHLNSIKLRWTLPPATVRDNLGSELAEMPHAGRLFE